MSKRVPVATRRGRRRAWGACQANEYPAAACPPAQSFAVREYRSESNEIAISLTIDRHTLNLLAQSMLRPNPLIRVRCSAIHGLGVFAARPLPAGSRLGTYEGRRLSAAEVDAGHWDSRLTYLFGLSDGTTINGAQGGNGLRHLNHSCAPNCEAVESWGSDGAIQLDIVVVRDVLEGEELCIDYALAIDASQSPQVYPCTCASVDCRGTMAASA
jgi:SET domain-containing protein